MAHDANSSSKALASFRSSVSNHRFPPPWSVEHRAAAKLLSRDGGCSQDRRDPTAWAIAVH
jgi:hypothetical protein